MKKLAKIGKTNGDIKKLLTDLNRKLDILIITELAKCGLKKEEISKVIGVDKRTIQNWIPFRKIKPKVMKNEKKKK